MTAPARVVQSARAQRDLIDLWYDASLASERAADRLIDRFDIAFKTLAEHPFSGARRDDLRKGFRQFVVRPYLILYRATKGSGYVVRVVDGRRDLPRMSR